MVKISDIWRPGESLRFDFHFHVSTARPDENNFLSKSLEGEPHLYHILQIAARREVHPYITNVSGDGRYELWTNPKELDRAIKRGWDIEVGDYFTVAKKNEGGVIIGKSDEMIDLYEHTLVIGLKRGEDVAGLNLEEISQQKRDGEDGEIIVAAHPYSMGGVLKHRQGQEVDRLVDAYELNASAGFWGFGLLPDPNERLLEYIKSHNMPLISCSDGHHVLDLGKGYTTFNENDLDFGSEKGLRKSIEENIKADNVSCYLGVVPQRRILGHALAVLASYYWEKIYNHYYF